MEPTKVPHGAVRVRRLALAGLALLAFSALVTGGLWFLNHSPLPDHVRAAAAAGLARWLGTDVSVESVRLAGPGRVVLENVRAAIDGGAVSVHLGRVVAGFSVWDWPRLLRAPMDAVRWVQVQGWEAVVPADWLSGRLGRWGSGKSVQPAAVAAADGNSGSGAGAATADRGWSLHLDAGRVVIAAQDGPLEATIRGRLTVDGNRLVLHGLQLALPGLTATGRGALWPHPDLHVQAEAADAAAAQAFVTRLGWAAGLTGTPDSLPVSLGGTAAGEVWVQGSWAAPRAWGRVSLEGLTVAVERVAQRPYALTEGTLTWSYWPARGLELSLDAARAATRVRVEGTVAAGGALELAVTATDLELPHDVAVVAPWGASGRADFFGRLSGTWRDPVVAGELAANGGHLFAQPFSDLSAQLRLSREELAFERVRIAQGLSQYFLEGRVVFGRAPDVPARLHLVVRTDRGRVEALTAAVGWDVPAAAGLSGTLVLSGPLGAVTGHGDLVLTQGVAWGQAFDRLAGQFHYGPEGFEIPEAVASVRGGNVRVQGGGRPAGPWELAVAVQDVPVQAVAGLRERLPAVSGLLSFVGTVRRDAGEPVPAFAGRLSGRHLRIGGLDFAEASGDVEFAAGGVRTSGITLRRHSGGTYTAAGVVRDAVAAPQLDLDIAVQGESLADVLALTGLRLPVLAPSGRVAAAVTLQGTLARPDARIRLDAPDVYVIGYRTGVAVELRVRDGRVEIEELSRAG